MNIVYITILLEAVSETIPSRLDFLKSKLNNKKGWTQPSYIVHTSQNKVSFLSSLEKKKVNIYKIFSSHLANFSPKKPKKAPWLS